MKTRIVLGGTSLLLLIILSQGPASSYSLSDMGNSYASILAADAKISPFTDEDLAEHQNLIALLTTEGFTIEVDGIAYPFPAQLKDLSLEQTADESKLSFTPEFMDYMLGTVAEAVRDPETDITLLEADATKTSRVTLEGVLKDGRELVPALTKEMIIGALARSETTTQGVLRKVEGKIINQTGLDLGPLDLLTEGKSSFWGSSPEREFNIRKALNERFNGILIPPGGEFSYVEFLGEIEYAGWKQATAIFKGTQLEPTPAGGVCQVSTTIYRAALNAGLEISEHRSHSLYVIYYQHFGDGLDATIFPGEQDFKFVNNTPNYMLMVTQEEGFKEAVIRFYGEDDGRSTELYGPYTGANQTDEVKAGVGAPLGIGQIAWKYLITHPDGTVETKWLLSDYMSPAQQHRGETPGLLEY
ncbi:MAG: VanW family protein [Patescibacteria group bacterium]